MQLAPPAGTASRRERRHGDRVRAYDGTMISSIRRWILPSSPSEFRNRPGRVTGRCRRHACTRSIRSGGRHNVACAVRPELLPMVIPLPHPTLQPQRVDPIDADGWPDRPPSFYMRTTIPRAILPAMRCIPHSTRRVTSGVHVAQTPGDLTGWWHARHGPAPAGSSPFNACVCRSSVR
jgi:hypothetical protein